MSVFHASILLLIMNFDRHNIVKIAVDPRGDSQVDLQTTIIDHPMEDVDSKVQFKSTKPYFYLCNQN